MKVLLVDDHADALDSLAGFITELGHEVQTAGDGNEALATVRRRRPDLIISDLRMPGMDGMRLLAALEEFESPPQLALLTAYAEAEVAIEAMRLGACDFLRKPVDIKEVHRLLERMSRPTDLACQAVGGPAVPEPAADGLIIAGPAMAAVVALADRLHEFPAMLALIEAETGCGKELVARRIHHAGQAGTAAPFVAVNCAAIPPGLFEAELFGYAPGAFTGAAAQGSPGRFVQAGDGTILLDEIGELPIDQQAKLLRVIEERTFFPVGGMRQQRLAARVVCATNRDLFHEAQQGRFREDLLYRLKVGYIRVPPLRERRDEILPLAHAFIRAARALHGSGFGDIEPAAAERLRSAPWPGNVRQLRHVLDRALLLRLSSELRLGPGLLAKVDAEDAPRQAGSAVAPAPPGARVSLPALPPGAIELSPAGFALDAWQGALIAAALKACHGSPVRTAAYLGISRKVLYTLRRRYGLIEEVE